MRTYTVATLAPGEVVEYGTTPHWLTFLQGTVLTVVGVATFVWGVSTRGPLVEGNGLWTVAIFVGPFVATVGVMVLFQNFIRYVTTEYVLTDRRLIYKRGFIARRTDELMLKKIDSVSISQSILGRIFGYGTIIATVATERVRFTFVTDPTEFARRIRSHL